MTHVTLNQLHKSYDSDYYAVKDLSLEVPAGSITALLGPSGCGKTTTLKMIAGLLYPNMGDICFNQESILGLPAERRGAVMVFQNHLLFPYMTVADNVGFGLKMRGEPRKRIKARVADILSLVKLSGFEGRYPKQLSGGQQQRVALARALVVEPRVLLLDEPLSNLDAHLRDEMRELILDIQRELRVTTIFVTHDQEEAVVLAHRVALMFEGQLQQYAAPRAFYETPVNQRTAEFFGGVNFLPATKNNAHIETPLGLFQSQRQNYQNGAAMLTIRPENLKLGHKESHNTLQGVVKNIVYVGTYTRFKIEVQGQPFEVVDDAASSHRYQKGQQVDLYFPPDKIWLVAREDV